MPFTTAQYSTLKNDIIVVNTGEFAARVAAADHQLIADAYNVVASPDFWVWRTSVPKQEIVGMTSQDGTTFTWAGNGFITRAVGELMAWQELFTGGVVNPSLPQVRAAFTDIFSGTGNAASNRAHLLAVARRKALRIERLFATGTGSTGSPGALVVEGALDYLDVYQALRGA
jgi:hypothetical protein